MVVQKTPYLQYRTFGEIYLFQAKNDTTITLRIYNIYREMVYKEGIAKLTKGKTFSGPF